MQIKLGFSCRECGAGGECRTDTAHAGVAGSVKYAELQLLLCSNCGHISGELRLEYRYREEHGPIWEREARYR